jgi:hypothetical protein
MESKDVPNRKTRTLKHRYKASYNLQNKKEQTMKTKQIMMAAVSLLIAIGTA